jgi:hypothetical protein
LCYRHFTEIVTLPQFLCFLGCVWLCWLAAVFAADALVARPGVRNRTVKVATHKLPVQRQLNVGFGIKTDNYEVGGIADRRRHKTSIDDEDVDRHRTRQAENDASLVEKDELVGKESEQQPTSRNDKHRTPLVIVRGSRNDSSVVDLDLESETPEWSSAVPAAAAATAAASQFNTPATMIHVVRRQRRATSISTTTKGMINAQRHVITGLGKIFTNGVTSVTVAERRHNRRLFLSRRPILSSRSRNLG